MYDYAIIGAGVNGCFMAYRLHQAGKKVLLIDPKGIGGSGSQAAGAFLSPKIGKGGELKAIVNQAYKEAIQFYSQLPDEIFTQHGLLHFPKDRQDALNFKEYKKCTDNDFRTPLANELSPLHDPELASHGLFFEDAGIVDPIALCNYLTKDIEFQYEMVSSLVYSHNREVWDLNICQSKNIILASGAYTLMINEPYIKLRAVWGERIEINASTHLCVNYHQNISISATKANNRIVIGATHEQHQMDKGLDPNSVTTLLSKASEIVELKNIELVDHRGGVRAGSFDYLPIVGPLIDSKKSLAKFPNLIKGAKVDAMQLCYHPNAFIVNGVGGRGFVLAPFLSLQLSEMLLEGCEIDSRITPDRLFRRWAKKEAKV